MRAPCLVVALALLSSACGDELDGSEIEPATGEVALGSATAVATFESLGLTWRPSGAAATRACTVRYRAAGESTWRAGLNLWFDARNGEYRGSLVRLRSGTTYEVQLALSGTSTTTAGTVRTWSDTFPIGSTVALPATSSSTLHITGSGTPQGYVLYTVGASGSAVIDVQNAQDYAIRVSGAYVIIRGLTLRGARRDGIRLEQGAHDVVIEDNDISGWGRVRDASRGWGTNYDAGIAAANQLTGLDRIVIQRNRIHTPRYGSNSWADGHPNGPQAITLYNCGGSSSGNPACGGNHVIRYNEIFSTTGRYFNDAIGAGENFSLTGFPNADTDIYGNRISHCWDDGIEAEGGNRNVRIFANYIDRCFTGIASTATSVGPLYVFRNVYDISRRTTGANDTDEHGPFAKLGDTAGYGGGRRYFFHNTLLQQPPPAGSTHGQGAGNGLSGGWSSRPVTEVYSRNNIWHVYRANLGGTSIFANSSSRNNDIDYELHSGAISLGGTGNRLGTHLTRAAPRYAEGHGPSSRDGGLYALAAGSPGFDQGELLPNFSDGFTGAAPDIGAHEAGTPALQFGRAAAASTPSPEPTPPTTTGLPLAINAGGSAVAPSVADTGFSGGTPYTNWTGAIDTSGVTQPAPAAVYQSERYGNMTYTVSGLTPGASYDLRLHFCENYFSAAGQRVFDVSVNGSLVLDDLDVLGRTGAAHRALALAVRASAGSSGQLVVQLQSVVNHAVLNGLEVLAPTAPPAPSFAVNAGGSAAPPFAADSSFSGGTAFTNWTGAIDRTGLVNPAPEAVYRSERYGNMTYTFSGLPAGASYLVRLHFCENYHNAAARRRFDVHINGARVLDDFDVFAAAGAAHEAVIREADVTASSTGRIAIVFTTVLNQALVNGIEILPYATAQASEPSGSTTTSPGTGTAVIATEDILVQARAGIPFAQQSGYGAQVLGTYPSAASIPESGIHGSTLPNGQTLRLGKVADPADSTRRALFFQLAPTDPSTSGSKRTELKFANNIRLNQVYWVAFSVYVHDWGALEPLDASIFGTQLHSGNSSLGLSPSVAIATTGGATMRIDARWSTSATPSQSNAVTARYAERPIPFGRWIDFVFKLKQNTAGAGFLQVWMDGVQIVDHQGSLGFNTPGYLDYMKFGYYNWSSAFDSPRQVLLRSPLLVADPTGSKYQAADLRAFVRAVD